MRINQVKHKLARGESSIGTYVSILDPFIAQELANVGLDWLLIEMEHSPITVEKAALMIMSMSAFDVAPIARIPWNTGENIKRILDAGAWGIMAPMIMNKQEAEHFVEMAKFPPEGRRSIGLGRYTKTFCTDPDTYIKQANEEVLLIIQIEHIKAVENIEKILEVPGIDVVYIGTNDLMASMGLTNNMDINIPRVEEAFQEVLQAAKKFGVVPGIGVEKGEEVQYRIEQGFRFIRLSQDIKFMLNAIKNELEVLKPGI